jgi:hypothetical protein
MTLTAVAVSATEIADDRWFQLLFVFVGFNTIIYAVLALAKLWPRGRR